MELNITLAFALGVTILGLWVLYRSRRRHHQAISALESATLSLSLDLLQALQRHRGLGAQQDAWSCERRAELAEQLNRLWQEWPAEPLHLPPLQLDWPLLLRKPADFSAHCRLIDNLIGIIERLEDHLTQGGHRRLRGFGQSCRALEDLARLRGLATRAANYAHCPVGLKMQIRFLCQRLRQPGTSESQLALMDHLEQALIDTPRITLTPQHCFSLVTPLIDKRLHELRHVLSQAVNSD